MNINIPSLARRLLMIVSMTILLSGVAAGVAAADSGDQKIFLDPDTGDVLSRPPTGEPRSQDAGKAVEGTSWVNDEGVDMYTPSEAEAPALQAVHCPDGSLRMGHAKTRAGQDERDALCAGSSAQ